MKDIGFTRVKIAGLKYDEKDIRARQKQAHVIELAESIKKLAGAPMNPPCIDGKSRRVMSGRDRLAAIILNGESMVSVHAYADVSVKDFEDAERDENLYRRDIDRDKLMKEAVEAEKKTILAKAEEEIKKGGETRVSGEGKRGPRKSDDAKAREVVAKKAGASPEAVRKATERAKQKANPKPKSSAPYMVSLNLYGLTPTAEYMQRMAAIQKGMDAVSNLVKSAQGTVSKLASGSVIESMIGGQLQAITDTLHAVGAAARGLRPKAVCLFCKDPDGNLKRRKTCVGCKNTGYLSDDRLKDVPEELLMVGAKAKVATVGGGFVLLRGEAEDEGVDAKEFVEKTLGKSDRAAE